MAVSAPAAATNSELIQILIDSQSQDQAVRRSAEEKLYHAEQLNFAAYLAELAQELSNESSQSLVRQLAGILLKNAISGTDPIIDKTKREKWMYVPENVSTGIKEMVLTTMQSSCEEAQSAACQVIAKIGRLDITLNTWPKLLPTLMGLITDTKGPQLPRKAAVTAFGYLCEDVGLLGEELGAELLNVQQRNAIVTALTKAMQDEDVEIVLAGCRAFYHAVPFAHEGMATTADRNFIFGLVARCLTCEDLRVLHAAWECTLQLTTEYYSHLEPYASDFGQLSLKTIQNYLALKNTSLEIKRQSEVAALAALEFWNTLCDIENILTTEGLEKENVESKQFVKRAAPVLLPVLFETITFDNREEFENDEWTLSMAAGTCVGLCAQVIGDDILIPALDFVNANFDDPSWIRRDAAVLVYGSIMDGPTQAQLNPLVEQSFPHLCRALNDVSVCVRDTAAWTIGRIASYHFQCILPMLDTTITLLIKKLSDEPRVAANICFAIHEIAHSVQIFNIDSLERYYQQLVTTLLTTAQRSDAAENNLRVSAFEALSEIISTMKNPEYHPIIIAVAEELYRIIEKSFTIQGNEEVWQLQDMVCGCLNGIYERLGSNQKIFLVYVNSHFTLLTSIINASLARTEAEAGATPYKSAFQGAEGLGSTEERTSTGSDEEAMLAIGSLIRNFSCVLYKNTPILLQIIMKGLQNTQNVRFCRTCIGVVSEIASVANINHPEVTENMGRIIPILYNILQDTTAPISLKPPLIGTISDIIVFMEVSFEPFLPAFINLLNHAASTEVTDGPKSEEWISYFQELRDSVFDAYSSILHGFRKSERLAVVKPCINRWLIHIQSTVEDKFASLSNLTKAADVAADMVACFRGECARHLLRRQDIKTLIEKGKASEDPVFREKAQLLKEAISQYSS